MRSQVRCRQTRLISRVVAVVAIATLLVGATVAIAGVTPGVYKGRTSDGITLKIKVAKSKQSGFFGYCGVRVPFSISGRTFSVSSDTVNASGKFKHAKVFGTIQPSGCTSTPTTYSLRHK